MVRAEERAHVDVERARARITSGRHGFDVAPVLRAAGDLRTAFERTVTAFESTGIVSTAHAPALRRQSVDATTLVLAWANSESTPRDPALRVARTVAGIVGNAVLARASDDVAESFSFAGWTRAHCPCCGASPDLAMSTAAKRTLVCWRCDTQWRTTHRGCLGCGANGPPDVARVPSPYLGYELAICNACGRYLKERRGSPAHALLVERALTAGLDEAAEQRGLRA